MVSGRSERWQIGQWHSSIWQWHRPVLGSSSAGRESILAKQTGKDALSLLECPRTREGGPHGRSPAALRRARVPLLSPNFPILLTSRIMLHVLLLETQRGPQGQRKALFLLFLITAQRPDPGSTGALSCFPFPGA